MEPPKLPDKKHISGDGTIPSFEKKEEEQLPSTKEVRQALERFTDETEKHILEKQKKIQNILIGIGIGIVAATVIGVSIGVAIATGGTSAVAELVLLSVFLGLFSGVISLQIEMLIGLPIVFILDAVFEQKVKERQEELRGYPLPQNLKLCIDRHDTQHFYDQVRELNVGLHLPDESWKIWCSAVNNMTEKDRLTIKGPDNPKMPKQFAFAHFIPAVVPDEEAAKTVTQELKRFLTKDFQTRETPTLEQPKEVQDSLKTLLEQREFRQARNVLHTLYRNAKEGKEKSEIALQCALMERKFGNHKNACAFFEEAFLSKIQSKPEETIASQDFVEYIRSLLAVDRKKAEKYFTYCLLSNVAKGRCDKVFSEEMKDYSEYFTSDVQEMFVLFSTGFLPT